MDNLAQIRTYTFNIALISVSSGVLLTNFPTYLSRCIKAIWLVLLFLVLYSDNLKINAYLGMNIDGF